MMKSLKQLLKERRSKKIDNLVNIASNLNIEVIHPYATGPTIVFLHGIASSTNNWHRVYENLSNNNRIVLVDLLGFGQSPTPKKVDYSVATHAKAVWLSLDAQGISGDIYLVGHSMGCIVATNMAFLRQSRIKQLYLVSLPIYKGYEIIEGTASRVDSFINKLYFKTYQSIRENSLLLLFASSMISNFLGGVIAFELRFRNLTAFRRSLINCIEFQRTQSELLNMPQLDVHIYYGIFDVLIIHKYLVKLAKGRINTKITKVKAGHVVYGALARAIASDLVKISVVKS